MNYQITFEGDGYTKVIAVDVNESALAVYNTVRLLNLPENLIERVEFLYDGGFSGWLAQPISQGAGMLWHVRGVELGDWTDCPVLTLYAPTLSALVINLIALDNAILFAVLEESRS